MEWLEALARLEEAYADATIKGYRADFAIFARWCKERDVCALPAAPLVVARFIDESASRKKPSTIKRRLCAIHKLHCLAGHASPVRDEDVRLAIRRAQRRQPGRPHQALGLTAVRRDRLLAACTDDLIGQRDALMVRVGFDTLCRRAELVGLRIDDLTRGTDDTYRVLVRRAKTDQNGMGRIATLSRDTTCTLDAWLDTTQLKSGPLFRPVYGTRLIRRYLEPLVVTRVLKKLSKRAGLPPEELLEVSGHSLRIGAAQELTLRGVGLLPLMAAGGWRSVNTVARYIENVQLNVWE